MIGGAFCSMSLIVDDRFAALSHGDHICAVYTDPAGPMVRLAVEHILSNLLGNALKYGEGRPIEWITREADGALFEVDLPLGHGTNPRH